MKYWLNQIEQLGLFQEKCEVREYRLIYMLLDKVRGLFIKENTVQLGQNSEYSLKTEAPTLRREAQLLFTLMVEYFHTRFK